eukprot:TRINITY_DN20316_c0_g1_i1.p1 TRINITY_DN20316_c0_g1~~TRINITY_DN20316_c0_g1_i1.p1  ORF type:complete len:126 (-),score=17.63 TRINITY_DN20316_c0_g1_i1:257-634(-)
MASAVLGSCVAAIPSQIRSHYAAQSLSASSSSLSGQAVLSALPLSRYSSSCKTDGMYPLVTCGRGDKRTPKGKRFRHSYGLCRPRKGKNAGLPPTPIPARPPKKDELDDGEFVQIDLDESLFNEA